MSKRKKIKNNKSPNKVQNNKISMTPRDKKILFSLKVLGIILCFSLICGLFRFQALIAFSDSRIIASASDFSFILAVPLVIFTVGLASSLICVKRPLFGDESKLHLYPVDEYPLLRKKPKYYYEQKNKPSVKKSRITKIISVIIVFSVCLTFYGFSIFGRTAVYNDGRIIKHNFTNGLVKEYSSCDVESITLTTYHDYKYKGIGRERFMMSIHLKDGEKVEILENEFDKKGFFHISFAPNNYCIDGMTELKNIYGNKKIIIDSNNLDTVIYEHIFSEEQLEKIYELYEVKQ